jgi:hypothetical protein
MDETSKKDSENIHFAPTVVHSNKAMFIVRVSYFVHVSLYFGIWCRPVIVKLPFLLKRPEAENVSSDQTSKMNPSKLDEAVISGVTDAPLADIGDTLKDNGINKVERDTQDVEPHKTVENPCPPPQNL